MISSQRGLTAYTRTRSCALSAAARNRPPYCIRGVAPTIAMERGLSILWIDAIWLSVQNSMPPPEKKLVRGSSDPQTTNYYAEWRARVRHAATHGARGRFPRTNGWQWTCA